MVFSLFAMADDVVIAHLVLLEKIADVWAEEIETVVGDPDGVMDFLDTSDEFIAMPNRDATRWPIKVFFFLGTFVVTLKEVTHGITCYE